MKTASYFRQDFLNHWPLPVSMQVASKNVQVLSRNLHQTLGLGFVSIHLRQLANGGFRHKPQNETAPLWEGPVSLCVETRLKPLG